MHSKGLSVAVGMWPTPTSQDSRHAQSRSLTGSQRGVLKDSNLGEKVCKIEGGGTFNQPFVEWLMGWPIGWTDLKALETGKFHSKWLMPFQSYLKELLTERNSLT